MIRVDLVRNVGAEHPIRVECAWDGAPVELRVGVEYVLCLSPIEAGELAAALRLAIAYSNRERGER